MSPSPHAFQCSIRPAPSRSDLSNGDALDNMNQYSEILGRCLIDLNASSSEGRPRDCDTTVSCTEDLVQVHARRAGCMSPSLFEPLACVEPCLRHVQAGIKRHEAWNPLPREVRRRHLRGYSMSPSPPHVSCPVRWRDVSEGQLEPDCFVPPP